MLVPGSASAVTITIQGAGSVSCSWSATVRFSPPLTKSGGGTRPTRLETQLSDCTTYGANERVARGWFTGHFSESPFSCTTLAQTDASLTGSTRWALGYDADKRAKFANSPIADDNVGNGSFSGTARIVLSSPASLSSLCGSGARIKSTTVTGTLTLGPSCGPGSGPLHVFQLVPGPMCGGVYFPANITTGSDGNLWFTNSTDTIKRITTSGVISTYDLPTGVGAAGITAGPDGALWFTGGDDGAPVVGKMTTSGSVTLFPVASGLPGPITAGPDGALWFVDYPLTGSSAPVSIDRITTSGAVTVFTSPSVVHPGAITAGPDGALWFADILNNSIDRITTSGAVTVFASPLITGPLDITAGADGALWFTNSNSIGRITTSGSVTRYFSSSITNPWSIASGPGNSVWFTNYAGSVIGSMSTSGVVTAHYSDPSIQVPFDITAGPDGNMWFTNYGSDTIGRITPP
jgi:virginiamycin B lyase